MLQASIAVLGMNRPQTSFNINKTDEDNLDTEPIHPINTTESDKDIKIKNDPPKKIK